MRILSATEIEARVSMRQVIEQLRWAFGRSYLTPSRQVVEIPAGADTRLSLIMPCFDSEGRGVVKLSTVFPDNQRHGLPAIQGTVIAFSDAGTPIAVLDGGAVTRLRTSAASALASSYLSRDDSTTLLIIGTGELAPSMAVAHCAVRPIDCVQVWGRREVAARATVDAIRARLNSQVDVCLARSLPDSVTKADIISCATSAREPVLSGAWLSSGAFVDLVGSFSPQKREADDDAIVRSRIFVDTYAGAYAEAGDLLDPIERNIITKEHIAGELSELVSGSVRGRSNRAEITLFKSVGTAIQDHALTQLLIESAL